MSKLKKSEGIVISNVKFGESSLISRIFTREDGLRSFIISGVRTKNNKGKAAFFQVGQLLDLDYYYKEKDGVLRIKEVSLAHLFVGMQTSILKIALSQYYIEIVKGSLYQSGEQSTDLYEYMREALIRLDVQKGHFTNLAPVFLWQYIPLLGFAPNLETTSKDCVFDLEEGQFISVRSTHDSHLSVEDSSYLKNIIISSYEEAIKMDIPSTIRKHLLDAGHAFLKLHLPYFTMPTTPEIFREILLG
jgi:DNA repair protein RecO (recombination protein O)